MSISLSFRKLLYPVIRKLASVKSIYNMTNKKPSVSIYEIQLKDIQGRDVTLSGFRGKRMLIVNTASECGYTPQYEALQRLHDQYGNRIAVLGFPCNDFGSQEPGSEQEIKTFCQTRFHVTFPLFSKVVVKGSDIHPLYTWLTDPAMNGWNTEKPSWNFCKYLVDEEGNLLHFFNSAIDPLDDRITGSHGKSH